MIKRELTVYLVTGNGDQYKLPVYSDARYSQTFQEVSMPGITLHSPNHYFSDGFSSQYNPGNFEFTIPLMDSNSATILSQILFSLEPFEIFFQTPGKTVRLNNSVVTGIVFNTTKDAIITASVEGQYSLTTSDPLYGTPAIPEDSLYTYIQGIQAEVNEEILDGLTGFNIELSNSVSWVSSNYMQSSLPYPTEYYISERRLSGNITKNEGLNVPTAQESIPLKVKVKSNEEIFLEFDLPSIILTSRPELDEVIKKGFDFRVNDNTNNKVMYKGVSIL